MELGEKLRQARLEAGLSQRQLCGGEITRNMLSLIENGTAKPSMKTLQYLAARLGKSVSFFLEEDGAVSPNHSVMVSARRLYDAGDYAAAALTLEAYQTPDAVFDREREILQVLTYLELAKQAAEQKRDLYALELLKKADMQTAYCSEFLKRQRLLLLGRLRKEPVSAELPSLDEELLLRAEDALSEKNPSRAAHLLEAADSHDSPRWHMLRGEAYLAEKNYKEAAQCFHGAEAAFPTETAAKLEHCYRELGDYKMAYLYACRQK